MSKVTSGSSSLTHKQHDLASGGAPAPKPGLKAFGGSTSPKLGNESSVWHQPKRTTVRTDHADLQETIVPGSLGQRKAAAPQAIHPAESGRPGTFGSGPEARCD